MKPHDWEPTDNQGRSMQCNACEISIYIEETKEWDAHIDAPCTGKPSK